MEKRYQVFVSSTFSDLHEERKAIIEMLLNAKYIPAGMEMFSASNDEQFKYIKKIIDNCDYYVLIIGARYGSINPVTNLSYTEQEYEYAISKNMPVLAFIHSDPNDLPSDKREDDKKELLDAFKNKVIANRMCRMWRNTNDLVSSVLISLIEEISENPQLGWSRGESIDATNLLEQLNELRIEKDQMMILVEKLKSELKDKFPLVENLASGDDIYIVVNEKYNATGTSIVKEKIELSWDQIFSAIGPHLISSSSYELFCLELRNSINSAYNQAITKIKNDCCQTIKIQLCALGLIDVSPAESEGGGIHEFITLTSYGTKYLIKLKSIKKL